jgi:hypothetical protein
MQRPSLPRSRRVRVISLSSIAAGVAALIAAGALVTTSSAADKPAATPTPVLPSATAQAKVERTPPTVIVIAKETPPPATKQKTLPLGPIAVEPVRVYTGDGDCLNVRPQPGLNNADPRFCVPEGHLLWFYGEAVDADGETWRYALGTGWVAARYTKPDPAAAGAPLPAAFSSVVVFGDLYNNGGGIPAARVNLATGSTAGFEAVPYVAQGIGARAPYTSPDGHYTAYATWDTTPKMTIRTLASGAEVTIPGVYPVAWSDDGRLLINIGDCATGCHYKPGWLEPGDAKMHALDVEADSGSALAWAADGQSVFYSPYPRDGGNGRMPIKRLWLDGRIETVLRALPDGVYAGEMTASPDGASLLLGSATGPIRTVDVASGTLREFPRAPQLPVLGRCGGASGKLSGWLEGEHVVYHESYAASGGNGITIGDLRDGSRRVLPFWSIQELNVVAPHTLSFSTWEGAGDVSFQLSWLLDTDSGVARPVAVGSAPVFLSAEF